jgi:epoxyqueuosine reductase QueG
VSFNSTDLATHIIAMIRREAAEAKTITSYREPLIGFAAATDPSFADLRQLAQPTHMLPQELHPSAQSVVSFFLPFDRSVVEANARHRVKVAREWADAYAETNTLIRRITAHLIDQLAQRGVAAAAEPPTDNFDPATLISRWSHKSVAVIAGIGSFGLHHLVITDSGCAGRFGSLVTEAKLPVGRPDEKERCLYFLDGSCLECVARCPVGALSEEGGIDKQLCWSRCQEAKKLYDPVGQSKGCGKCALGPCAIKSAV